MITRWRFGAFELDLARQQLLHAGMPVRLEPRVLELLAYLAAHAGRVISKDELLREVWKTPHLTDWAVSRALAELRKTLRQHDRQTEWIKTIYGRGFRMLELVEPLGGDTSAGEEHPLRVRNPTSHLVYRPWLAGSLLLVLLAWAWSEWSNSPVQTVPMEAVPSAVPRVVVLVRSTTDAVPDWLAEGLADQLISGLAHQTGVRVYSRGTGMRLLRASNDPLAEASRLGADHALDLSLRQEGESILATAALIRTADGIVLSSEVHRGPPDRVGSLSAGIVAEVLSALPGLSGSEPAVATAVTREAEVALLRGRHFLDRRGPGDLAHALEYFDQALATDPDYAAAWASKALAHLLQRVYYQRAGGEPWTQARLAAERALALDPDLADTHVVLGLLALNADWDFAAADRHYRRAIALAPSHTQALQSAAELAMLSGHYAQGLAQIEQASELDPVSPLLTGIWGLILATAGDYPAARAKFVEALELDPRFLWLHRELAHVAEFDGDVTAALQHRRQEMVLRGVPESELARFDALTAEAGLDGFRRWYLDWLGGVEAVASSPVPELLAENLAALGEHPQAEAIIRQHGRQTGESMLHLLTRSPAFRHQRYRQLARELGLNELVIPGG